jgi:hypothetical protein
MRILLSSVAFAACAGALVAQGQPAAPPNSTPLPPAPAQLPRKHAPRPTTAAITAADLMTRLYIFADDSMQGRMTASPGHERGLRYIERELRRLGLRPLGDDGGYRQRVPLIRRRLSRLGASVDGRPLRPWDDIVLFPPQAAPLRPLDGARVVFGGTWQDAASIPDSLVAGRIVVLDAYSAPPGPQSALDRLERVAAGVILAQPTAFPSTMLDVFKGATMTLHERRSAPLPTVATLGWTTRDGLPRWFGVPAASLVRGTLGGTLRGDIAYAVDTVESYNVLAMLPGRDPRLEGQYVALGAHSDHLGFDDAPVDHDSLMYVNRVAWWQSGATSGLPPLDPASRAAIRVPIDSLRRLRPARPDSIFNGADDDGSGSMALLEIAENIVRGKLTPRRSLFFAWHTGEERGLLGSRWLSDRFPIPRDSIVAQLNIDMISRGEAIDVLGQGGPRYIGMVGSKRLSTGFGAMIDSLNAARARPLTIDYRLDADGHPENVYCRSDHYQYARWGIPVAFFFTGIFGDYHQRTDEPQYVDYGPYAMRTNFIRDVLLVTANGPRPVVDRPKPDPNGACRQ